MIPKAQLLLAAASIGGANAKLLATTIEKDYALSWVLWGLSRHNDLSQWLFKGGTCLKKCFFDTYRFSEDLDFTVPIGAVYDKNAIETALRQSLHEVNENTGIEFPADGLDVRESVNKQQQPTFAAKVTFIGPLQLGCTIDCRRTV